MYKVVKTKTQKATFTCRDFEVRIDEDTIYIIDGGVENHSMGTAETSSRSHCLVNDPHLIFIHSAAVQCYFRQSSFDLTKIRRRQLNIDRSQVLMQVIDVARTRDWNNP
jgi:hypothetical protein